MHIPHGAQVQLFALLALPDDTSRLNFAKLAHRVPDHLEGCLRMSTVALSVFL